MKSIYTLVLLVMSLILMGQYSQYNSDENPFNINNSNRQSYDDLYKKREKEINQEMQNVRSIVRKSETIYNFFQNDGNEVQNQNDEENATSSGPGAPGEPVPIDKKNVILFLASAILLIVYARKIKSKNLI